MFSHTIVFTVLAATAYCLPQGSLPHGAAGNIGVGGGIAGGLSSVSSNGTGPSSSSLNITSHGDGTGAASGTAVTNGNTTVGIGTATGQGHGVSHGNVAANASSPDGGHSQSNTTSVLGGLGVGATGGISKPTSVINIPPIPGLGSGNSPATSP